MLFTHHTLPSSNKLASSSHHRHRVATKTQPHAACRRRPCVRAAAAATSGGDPAPVVIAGAGIAGLAAAVALHRAGVPAVVLERAPAPRGDGAAIALWANAWRALDALGVGERVRDGAPLLSRIELVRSTGRALRGFALSECDAAKAGGAAAEFRGVRRGALLQSLLDALPAGAVRFGVGVDGVEEGGSGAAASSASTGAVVARLSDGSTLACRALIGADGTRSRVAAHLGLPPPNYAGYVAYRGVATYAPGALPLPRDTVRQVWGAGVRAGMYPLSDSEVYWFTCFNAPEGAPDPGTPAGRAAEALASVNGWQWGVAGAIAATPPEALTRSRVRDRWPAPNAALGRGCVTLAGDAAHPMTPNLGQGGCAALEDAVVLARVLAPAILDNGDNDGAAVAAALRRYEAARVKRALPLTVRSWAFGALLQLPYPPVTLVRDEFVARAFSPAHFLDHTAFDCTDAAAV